MKTSLVASLLIVVSSCQPTQPPHEKPSEITPIHVAYTTLTAQNGDQICFGGYGSSMCYDPKEKSFYLLTDRGPSANCDIPNAKVFPFPEYSPTIGKFKQVGDSLVLIKKITLKEKDGRPLLGLPNQSGEGVTAEIPYNLQGEQITLPNRGIDPEGLTLAPDGTFWISDEYAPFIMQFSPDGTLLREFSPSNIIPDYYAKRRPNKGMEGITISPDGTKLYAIMQSPLYLPDERTKNESRNCRLLEINLQDNTTSEFIYTLEDPNLRLSDIQAITNNSMLVIERDSKIAAIEGAANKKIYKIDITQATNISNQEIEMLKPNELEQKGIKPVEKKLLINIMKEIPNYLHDKVEGLALIDPKNLAIVNDDDFSVNGTSKGTFKPKINGKGERDHSSIYIIPLNQ